MNQDQPGLVALVATEFADVMLLSGAERGCLSGSQGNLYVLL